MTYENDVHRIIDRRCNNGSCHTGLEGGWAVLPDFTTYETILPVLESGKFYERLFESDSNLVMPPLRLEERQFTNEEKEKMRCWVENEFPKN